MERRSPPSPPRQSHRTISSYFVCLIGAALSSVVLLYPRGISGLLCVQLPSIPRRGHATIAFRGWPLPA
ncbi:hypothetical protein FIBSPDRAFT_868402 [Athelia psychrophila]|uniref:Uncharacterized protein n=1 Tax=Athelia psychrophila TaxID=1759441 RepID=A0A166D4B9_9AGAM|nr:hypothetical protein FIBSPDRAFT_868402 [Fibularhizoctonia sp. CBS 109695]